MFLLVALFLVLASSVALLVAAAALAAISPAFRRALIGDQHAQLESWRLGAATRR